MIWLSFAFIMITCSHALVAITYHYTLVLSIIICSHTIAVTFSVCCHVIVCSCGLVMIICSCMIRSNPSCNLSYDVWSCDWQSYSIKSMLLGDEFYKRVQINSDIIHQCMIVKHFYRKFPLLLTVTLTLCKLCINYSPVWSFSIRLGPFSLKN